jgi:predicted nucleic-acid-binding protein
VKITADTNVLIRVLTRDDANQSRIAEAELADAAMVALTLPALCEVARVLSRGYNIPSADIAEAIRRLINGGNVVVDRPAVEAGLALLEAGGDFADGVMAYEGRRLGADAFFSSDRKAVRLLQAQGEAARLLA